MQLEAVLDETEATANLETEYQQRLIQVAAELTRIRISFTNFPAELHMPEGEYDLVSVSCRHYSHTKPRTAKLGEAVFALMHTSSQKGAADQHLLYLPKSNIPVYDKSPIAIWDDSLPISRCTNRETTHFEGLEEFAGHPEALSILQSLADSIEDQSTTGWPDAIDRARLANAHRPKPLHAA